MRQPYPLEFSRRDLLRLMGAAGLAMPLRAGAQPAKAKAVIQIWMWGGPAHLDTFDPKPAAGYDYCGPFDKPIATNVGGVADQRTAPAAGATGRQVLAHPQHDARHLRARNGVVRGADRPQAGRAAGLSHAPARWSRSSRAKTPARAA